MNYFQPNILEMHMSMTDDTGTRNDTGNEAGKSAGIDSFWYNPTINLH